jgi:signal transduction histidine kinase
MLKKIPKLHHDNALILEMLKAKVSGVIPSNILAAFMAIYIVYDYLPYTLIYGWLLLHLTIAGARLYIGGKLEEETLRNGDKINYYLVFYSSLIALTGLLYAIISCLSLRYGAPDLNTIVIASMLIILTAGSLATLGTVFKVFLHFMLSSTIPLLVLFIFHDGLFFKQFSFIIFTYTFIHILSGYRLFLTHKRTLKAESELAILNHSLKQKIDKEVEKNRLQNQQLIEQSRLAQMGEMIAMIAHQWRQPLSAISATSATITVQAQLETLNNDKAYELAKNISSTSQHLSKTIDDFRNFFNDNKEKELSSLKEIVEDTLNIMEASIVNKNITIVTNSLCQKEFETFPSEVKQVLLNILKNAQDVLIDKEIPNPKITLNTSCSDKVQTLSISDNAGGIPQDIIHKIFDPYFSTKLQKDGTGLGLYMSKMIIEDHCEGKLYVHNSESGAVFTIKF